MSNHVLSLSQHFPIHFVSSPLQAEEEVGAAKAVYEGINDELKEELPTLFER